MVISSWGVRALPARPAECGPGRRAREEHRPGPGGGRRVALGAFLERSERPCPHWPNKVTQSYHGGCPGIKWGGAPGSPRS